MRALTALFLLGLVCCATAAPLKSDPKSNYELYNSWKSQFEVLYASPMEDALRFSIFQSNLEIIDELKERNPNTEFGLTEFAAMTYDEFKSERLGTKKSPSPKSDEERLTFSEDQVKATPDSYDWRGTGAVTSVKNQGNCGSCWSFSAAANIEGQLFLTHNISESLSEQQIVDCVATDQGCDGGLMDDAFAWLEQNGGLETDQSYPYTGKDGTCNFQESLAVVNISGYDDIPQNETQMATALYSVGPLSAAVNAVIEWQFYTGGVLEPWLCNPEELDHGITIVGYGTHKTYLGVSKEVWVIKNSWGSTWGDKGYCYLLRNNNECGISESVSTSHVA